MHWRWAQRDLERGVWRGHLYQKEVVLQLHLILPFGNENPSVINVLIYLFVFKEELQISTLM